MPRKHRFESEALQFLYDRYIGDDPKMQRLYEEALYNFEMAQQLYDLRKQSGLTQAQLAKSVGTSTSVISRLESADYNGHSLSMIRRIAAALGKDVKISFVEADSEPSVPKSKSSN